MGKSTVIIHGIRLKRPQIGITVTRPQTPKWPRNFPTPAQSARLAFLLMPSLNPLLHARPLANGCPRVCSDALARAPRFYLVTSFRTAKSLSNPHNSALPSAGREVDAVSTVPTSHLFSCTLSTVSTHPHRVNALEQSAAKSDIGGPTR